MAGNDTRRARYWHPSPRHANALGIMACCIGIWVALATIADWRARHLLVINGSHSLPNWAFMIERGASPRRGDYVFFDPPANALVRRHFGPVPQMFGKIVYGMPGDIVAHDGTIVTINGARVAVMKPRSRLREPLTPGVTGIIPAGCYFAGTPHLDGLDSRYAEIGLVCARAIVGTGEPVL